MKAINQLVPHQLLSIVFAIVFLFSTGAGAAPMKAAALIPDPPENLFWGNVMSFMNAVAEDLDIELEIVESLGASTYKLKRDGMKIINSPDKPDYIITGYWIGVTDKLLETAAKKDIGVFIFNTGISAAEQQRVGAPRQRHRHWIGHMMPDDVQAGYQLADILADTARELHPGKGKPILKVAGLSGTADSSVAADRDLGLQQKVENDPQLEMTAALDTDWRYSTAGKATEELLSRYPDLSIVWTAADALALGAVDILKDKGLQPGVDVVTGGIDWSDDGIRAVKRGDMAATLGGHFMEGGWALILAYDYHNGIDFSEDLGTTIVTPMQAITGRNVDAYVEKIGDQNWRKIDFRQFSKTYNKSLDRYDFSLNTLLENIARGGEGEIASTGPGP